MIGESRANGCSKNGERACEPGQAILREKAQVRSGKGGLEIHDVVEFVILRRRLDELRPVDLGDEFLRFGDALLLLQPLQFAFRRDSQLHVRVLRHGVNNELALAHSDLLRTRAAKSMAPLFLFPTSCKGISAPAPKCTLCVVWCAAGIRSLPDRASLRSISTWLLSF